MHYESTPQSDLSIVALQLASDFCLSTLLLLLLITRYKPPKPPSIESSPNPTTTVHISVSMGQNPPRRLSRLYPGATLSILKHSLLKTVLTLLPFSIPVHTYSRHPYLPPVQEALTLLNQSSPGSYRNCWMCTTVSSQYGLKAIPIPPDEWNQLESYLAPSYFDRPGWAVNSRVKPTVDHILLNHIHQRPHYNFQGPVFSSVSTAQPAPLYVSSLSRPGPPVGKFLNISQACNHTFTLSCTQTWVSLVTEDKTNYPHTYYFDSPFYSIYFPKPPNVTTNWTQASYFGTSICPTPSPSCPYQNHNF